MTKKSNNLVNNDDIELTSLIEKINRKRAVIYKFLGITILLSTIYTLISKPTWEGTFEILLSNKETAVNSAADQLAMNNPGLAALIGDPDFESRLKTEVKILESPSVLKSAFKYYLKKKNESDGINKKIYYQEWLEKNLSIELQRGTSVVKLSYRDKDKDIILPIINKISKDYQEYSGRDRVKGLNLAINFLDNQIALYKEKSIESLRKAQKYAIEQDLAVLKGKSDSDEEILNYMNLEEERVKFANLIRNYEQQLIQLEKIKDKDESIIYQGSVIEQVREGKSYKDLLAINKEINNRKLYYKENDLITKRLIKTKENYMKLIKKEAIGFLKAKIKYANSKMIASERPKGVIIKYRELLRESIRDEKTLNRVESEKSLLELEKARDSEPWELITEPNLSEKPVGLKNIYLILFSGVFGIFIGILKILIDERISDVILSTEEIKSLIKFPLIAKISIKNLKYSYLIVTLFLKNYTRKDPELTIDIIRIGEETNDQYIKQIETSINSYFKRETVKFKNEGLLKGEDMIKKSILVLTTGKVRREEIKETLVNLAINENSILGYIVYDNYF